ncbi:MAG TPA: SpoIIE family protein phosphatase [Vicinamibacteria bacterium]|nr:SpoIIE family protein phosphatase [Vicinamibacteria bacterium]
MSAYQLPAPPAPAAERAKDRARQFLLTTWRGRVLLAALAVALLDGLGLEAGALGGLARFVLWAYGLVGLALFATWAFRRLLWRIRTKLLVSYLFIAVVPMVLLGLLFYIAWLLFSGLVGSHLVLTEVDRVGQLMEATAHASLRGLPADPAALERALTVRLAPARELHPELRFVLVRSGRRVLGDAALPQTLPAWLETPGFAGLVKAGDAEVLRALWHEGDEFLLLEAPLDGKTFERLSARTGIRMFTVGGTVTTESDGRGVSIAIDDSNARQLGDVPAGGMPFIATPERTDWATGKREPEPLTFGFQPVDLIRHLSPGALNMGDLLVKALAVVGAVFLFVYIIALSLGLVLARSITGSIHALSVGTEKLRQGDFGHVIKVSSRDQLGELAESFNLMGRGIEDLLQQRAEKERLEEELRIARQIQMSLLPPEGAIAMAGLRIAALCLPAAEVGGDYYDLIPLSPTRMGVLIADVSGKGTSAALYMAELKGLALSLSRIYDSPAKLLCEANQILSANMDSRSFITMTYAIVDTAARTMRYARAGHNPILHLEKATGRTRVLTPAGLGLGIDRGDRFEKILEEAQAPLAPGDLFLFFTDGLSEAMNPKAELFGEARLREILEAGESLGSDELKERILEEIRSFVGEAAQNDDMTMVILKVV